MTAAEMRNAKMRRFMCLNFFAPVFFAIPLFIESGLCKYLFAHKSEKAIRLFQIIDIYCFVYGFSMYNVISKMVTSIVYNVEDNTFTVKQLSSWRLQEREMIFKPDDLVKHYRKSINPFIGYKSRRVEDGVLYFATEHGKNKNFIDRQFLDSMIYKIKKSPPRPAKKDAKILE